MSVLIIDNFLQFPTQVREWAVNQQYFSAAQFTKMYGKHTDWPGKRTQHVADLDKEYADIVLGRIATIAQSVFGLKNISIKSYFQLTTEDDGDSWVHQDNNVKLACLLYLNPSAPKQSGTTLYHCKDAPKWESFMNSPEGYGALKKINQLEDVQLYNELFEPVDVVGNVFNRLVMYPGDSYHKSNKYFGTNVKDGRLTQVCFISEDDDRV